LLSCGCAEMRQREGGAQLESSSRFSVWLHSQSLSLSLSLRVGQMTHRGPFQPLPFCDSVILSWLLARAAWGHLRACWKSREGSERWGCCRGLGIAGKKGGRWGECGEKNRHSDFCYGQDKLMFLDGARSFIRWRGLCSNAETWGDAGSLSYLYL